MSRGKKSKVTKRLNDSDDKTEQPKKEIVEQLKKTSIVQLACERVGVGRSTYYYWRAQDLTFARAADRAIEAGRFFINDLAESKLIKLIQNENVTAIIFWLKNNHPKFAGVNRIIHEYEIVTKRLSVEERNVIAQEMAKMMSDKFGSRFTAKDFRRLIEGELKQAGRSKKRRPFEDDLGDE